MSKMCSIESLNNFFNMQLDTMELNSEILIFANITNSKVTVSVCGAIVA